MWAYRKSSLPGEFRSPTRCAKTALALRKETSLIPRNFAAPSALFQNFEFVAQLLVRKCCRQCRKRY